MQYEDFKSCLGADPFWQRLIVVVQLADPPQDSPAVRFQRLPDVSVLHMAHAAWAARQSGPALLLMEYVIENDLPDKAQATDARQKIFAQLAVDNTPVSRLKATGWAAVLAGGNSFESLAGNTVADAVSYGEIAEVARQGGFEGYQDDFTDALNSILGMAQRISSRRKRDHAGQGGSPHRARSTNHSPNNSARC